MKKILRRHRDLRKPPAPGARRPIAGPGIAPLGLLAAAVAGCGTTLAPTPQGGSYTAYRIGAPDELMGDVPAGGRSAEEIATDVENRIARCERDAKVAVDGAQSMAITVLGELRRQRNFPLQKETRVVTSAAGNLVTP